MGGQRAGLVPTLPSAPALSEQASRRQAAFGPVTQGLTRVFWWGVAGALELDRAGGFPMLY